MLIASSAPPSACDGQRAVRAPDVLADADADLDAADDVQLERVGLVARREVAGLVEHGVVRQQALAVRAEDLALGAHAAALNRSRSSSTNPTTAAQCRVRAASLASAASLSATKPGFITRSSGG